jgi:hypothetical protein
MVVRDTTMRVRQEALRSLAFGSIGAGYAAVGAAIADEAELICFVNNTNADVIMSYDGTNDHVFLPMYSSYVADFRTNDKQLANRTIFYVKHNGVAATLGSVYVEVTV